MKRILSVLPALLLVLASPPVFAADASPPPAASATTAASVAGTYVSPQNSREYLTLRPDGTFTLKQQSKPYNIEHPYMTFEGSFKMEGEKVMLLLRDGGEATGKIQDNAFVDTDGKPWMKQNAPAPKKTEDSTPSRKRSFW